MANLTEDTATPTDAGNTAARTIGDLLLLMSRMLALIVLAIYMPALLGAALLVLLSSSGPAFVTKAYRRKNGEVVHLYEFRTECWTTFQETPVGGMLRNADIVRLPRLANVLMGQIGAGERLERVHV